MTTEYLQLGAVAVIFLFAVKEFFSYLKTRNGNSAESRGNTLSELGNELGVAGNSTSVLILEELRLMNGNHLHSIQKTIEEGNAKLTETIHSDNMKIVESLGEIKGRLSK